MFDLRYSFALAAMILLAAAPGASALIQPAMPDYELSEAAWAWDEIGQTGTPLVGCDDCVFGPFPIGFEFPFYGEAEPEVAIGTNGLLYFGPAVNSGCCSGDPLPSYLQEIVAAYWDDLLPYEDGMIRYQLIDEIGNERFVVQWTNVTHYGGDELNTFQVALFKSGDIEVRIAQGGTRGSEHTIGIEKDNDRYLEAYHGAGRFSFVNFRFDAPLQVVLPPIPPLPVTVTNPGSPLFENTPVDELDQDVGPIAIERQTFTGNHEEWGYRSGTTRVLVNDEELVYVSEEFFGSDWGYKYGYLYVDAAGHTASAGYASCTSWDEIDVFVRADGQEVCHTLPAPLP